MERNMPYDFDFYAVLTEPILGYKRLTEILVEHEVAFIQLRMKNQPLEEVRRVARVMRDITSDTDSRFIVNDHPEIAAEVGADGVHIGQDDMPYDEVRKIVGPDAIVGLSTHSPRQTEQACALVPDYIGVGPVYATPTKENPDPVIGIDGMKRMVTTATVPAVAIGGINLENLPEVLKAGARHYCMVRQVTQSREPGDILKKAAEIVAQFRHKR